MKVKLNPIIEEMSGGFGELVFRATSRGTILARKPSSNNYELSEDQAEHRERFREAVAYGKSVMADSAIRALYEQVAESKDMPVFALTVADFFNAPTIRNTDLLAYAGRVGDVIKVHAMDDFGVVSASVSILEDGAGSVIESGFASETAPGSGIWVYTASAAVPAGTTVSVNVVVSDRPGGTAVDSKTKAL